MCNFTHVHNYRHVLYAFIIHVIIRAYTTEHDLNTALENISFHAVGINRTKFHRLN